MPDDRHTIEGYVETLNVPLKDAREAAQGNPSHRARLVTLKVGESHAMVRRLELGHLDGSGLKIEAEALRSCMQAAVARARDETNAVYTIEGGAYFTRDNHLIVCMTATRTQ